MYTYLPYTTYLRMLALKKKHICCLQIAEIKKKNQQVERVLRKLQYTDNDKNKAKKPIVKKRKTKRRKKSGSKKRGPERGCKTNACPLSNETIEKLIAANDNKSYIFSHTHTFYIRSQTHTHTHFIFTPHISFMCRYSEELRSKLQVSRQQVYKYIKRIKAKQPARVGPTGRPWNIAMVVLTFTSVSEHTLCSML